MYFDTHFEPLCACAEVSVNARLELFSVFLELLPDFGETEYFLEINPMALEDEPFLQCVKAQLDDAIYVLQLFVEVADEGVRAEDLQASLIFREGGDEVIHSKDDVGAGVFVGMQLELR